MSAAALLLALAAPLAAQSTGTVAASTDTVSASTAAAEGWVVPADEAPPKPSLVRPIRVKIHKEAKSWEPVSVKAGGEPSELSTRVELRIPEGKGKKGTRSKATAVARVHPKNDDKILIVAIFPEALKKARTHLELRLTVVEGFLEKAQIVAVTAEKTAQPAPPEFDARKLRLAGIPFAEEFASDAAVSLAAIDPAATKNAVNAGKLKAQFASEDLGLVSLTYSVTGVNLKDKAAAAVKGDPELPGCAEGRRPDVPLLRARAQEAAEAEDFDSAFASACLAARAGDPVSQHIVATIFRHGYGTARPVDLKLAAAWYARAAAKNYGPSAGAMAELLRRSDFDRSHEYLRQAARLGHAPSQAGLGEAYRRGKGEEKDFVEAYRWYWLAYKQGHPGAERALDELAQDMSPMQTDEARRRAELVRPRPDL